MTHALDRLSISGFKSIRELKDLELKSLNVFVGANGAGKSNLMSFFKMLQALITGNIVDYVRNSGGISDLLFNGRKVTDKMGFEMRFGERGYRFKLVPTVNELVSIQDEARFYSKGATDWWELGDSSDYLPQLVKEIHSSGAEKAYSARVFEAIGSWHIYHFHDTGTTAGMRHPEIVEDCMFLRQDAANIAPYLLWLKEQAKPSYQDILKACRLVIPFLDDFLLQPLMYGPKTKVGLSWLAKGSDYPMQPYHLSDGSIRFICLATALLQPNPPPTLIIDEPELGLHPAAIEIVAELMQAAAQRTQLIVATQSPALLDQFGIEDIVIVKRQDGASVFERLKQDDYDQWLEEYSLGQLWTKNVIHGGPVHE